MEPGPVTRRYEREVAAGRLREDTAQRAVLPALDALADWLAAHPTRKVGLFAGLFARPEPVAKGLYLWGGVGRGKSMLMDLFFAEAELPAKRRVHFHAFMQEVHHGMHAARSRGVEDALAPVADGIIAEIRLLAFDEMQITDITDAMIVGRLFDKLFSAGVVIVTTSNRPPPDLYKDGLNRALFLPFIDMLQTRLEVIEIAGPTDFRQNRLSGAQVYFHPAAASRAAIQTLWDDLTGGAAPAPLVLEVVGRRIELPAYANGVGRARFWDLCARALGPGDFLAIAAACRVLILEDIPQLSSENYNEAKRFVTLVDALYEARVRLIASAADAPERLYLEGAGSFEFARTASRLREMQAAGWGADRPG
jgi:cell division protein ZapE